jgi:hypothetical protein
MTKSNSNIICVIIDIIQLTILASNSCVHIPEKSISSSSPSLSLFGSSEVNSGSKFETSSSPLMTGRKGGFIFLSAKSSQLIPPKNA